MASKSLMHFKNKSILDRIIILFSILELLNVLPSNGQLIDQNSGYAYIKGIVKDFNNSGGAKDYITINYLDWTKKSPSQFFLEIDKNGNFSDSIYLINSQDIILNYNGTFKTIFVSPKDTNIINIDGNSIKSNNLESELVSTYFNELKLIKGNPSNGSNTNFSSYRDGRFKLYKEELKLNKKFVSDFDASNCLRDWLSSFTTLRFYNDLASYLSLQKRSIFNDSIISKVVSEIFDSLSINSSGYKRNSTYYILLNNITELVNKQVLFEGSCLKSIRSNYISINHSSESSKNANIPIEDFNKGIYLCFINSLGFIHNNEIRELLITNRYLQVYEKGNFDLSIDTVLTQLRDSLIINNFLKQYTAIRNSKNLNSKMVLNLNPGDKLLGDIQDRYPNSIICLIFWSTWCSPCYSHILDLEASKERFNSKNLTFVYLCCQSKQNIWEEKLKMLNIGGTHYLLDNSQYAFLSQKFNINGFPKTVLISKSSKYVIVSAHNSEQIFK